MNTDGVAIETIAWFAHHFEERTGCAMLSDGRLPIAAIWIGVTGANHPSEKLPRLQLSRVFLLLFVRSSYLVFVGGPPLV